jgi:ABC-type antimicrobial peptide transport system permease subunit
VQPIREVVWGLDPDQPVDDVRTMAQIFRDGVATMDAVISMLGAFALFALWMAAAGIYGVMSFLVAQRRQEFGVRMALGASGGDVSALVMRQSFFLLILGVAAGLLGGFLLTRVMTSGLSDLSGLDPWTVLTVTATLLGVAVLAALVPAHRATRVDPLIALRAD